MVLRSLTLWLSLLSTTGCALFGAMTGNLPKDVAWSTSLAHMPTTPQYCFTTENPGSGRAFDTCADSMAACLTEQQRAGGKWMSPCEPVTTPFCFVYDVKSAKQVYCSATQGACERESAAIGRGFLEPVTASACGPLEPAVAAPVAPAPTVDLQTFLNDLDVSGVSGPLRGQSNGTPLKPVNGFLSRAADGTFFLRLTDLASGGMSEFGITLPSGLKAGQTYERKSTPTEGCGSYENQVFDAKLGAYRFNDAACAWRVELTSLPTLPKKNPKDGQENVGVVKGRLVMRLVQSPVFKPTTVVAPSWVGGSFELPVHLSSAD
ncbi:MAG: hypothetical protein SFW67_19650 [Myxococcaceae bacterium]|nr:hypothetical protein [Myxococcaceae bacterium]